MSFPARLISIVTLFIVFFGFSASIYFIGTKDDHASPMNEQARKGKLHYQKYNCTACHQLYGLGGYLGPDLTNAWSKYNDNGAYIRGILGSGIGIMPNFHMTNDEIAELLQYLKYTDDTGEFPGKPRATWYGSFEIEDEKE